MKNNNIDSNFHVLLDVDDTLIIPGRIGGSELNTELVKSLQKKGITNVTLVSKMDEKSTLEDFTDQDYKTDQDGKNIFLKYLHNMVQENEKSDNPLLPMISWEDIKNKLITLRTDKPLPNGVRFSFYPDKQFMIQKYIEQHVKANNGKPISYIFFDDDVNELRGAAQAITKRYEKDLPFPSEKTTLNDTTHFYSNKENNIHITTRSMLLNNSKGRPLDTEEAYTASLDAAIKLHNLKSATHNLPETIKSETAQKLDDLTKQYKNGQINLEKFNDTLDDFSRPKSKVFGREMNRSTARTLFILALIIPIFTIPAIIAYALGKVELNHRPDLKTYLAKNTQEPSGRLPDNDLDWQINPLAQDRKQEEEKKISDLQSDKSKITRSKSTSYIHDKSEYKKEAFNKKLRKSINIDDNQLDTKKNKTTLSRRNSISDFRRQKSGNDGINM